MKFILVVIWLTLISISAEATVRSGLCSEEFLGKLKVVLEDVGDLRKNYETQRIIFTNLETIRGDVSEEVILEILKFGPFQFKEENVYRIQMNNGKICWLEEEINYP